MIKEREEISIQTPQDLFNEIAWQQGYFSFKAQTLEQLMQNLSRWYNVDYIFQNPEKGKLLFYRCFGARKYYRRLINLYRKNQ